MVLDLSKALNPITTTAAVAAAAVAVTLWINSSINTAMATQTENLQKALAPIVQEIAKTQDKVENTQEQVESIGGDMTEVKWKIGAIEQILREQWKRSEMSSWAQLLEAWNQDPTKPLRVPDVPTGQ